MTGAVVPVLRRSFPMPLQSVVVEPVLAGAGLVGNSPLVPFRSRWLAFDLSVPGFETPPPAPPPPPAPESVVVGLMPPVRRRVAIGTFFGGSSVPFLPLEVDIDDGFFIIRQGDADVFVLTLETSGNMPIRQGNES